MMNLSSDWPYIQQIAAERLRNNKTPRHRAKYGTEIEVMGAAGELAARRFLGLPENLGTTFDGGIDLYLHGITVDVKSTKPSSKWLQVAYYKRVAADMILMMFVDTNRFEARPVGFAWRGEVLNAPLDLLMDDPCHRISIDDLHTPKELLYARNRTSPKAIAHYE
jgi:hypothetical protein